MKVPLLFKYGPWGLIVGGVLLCVATLLAGQWRVVEGRKGEYEKAFQTAKASAESATENINMLMERLWQASYQATSSPAPRVAQGPGLRVSGVLSFVFRSGNVSPVSATTPEQGALAAEALRSTRSSLPAADSEIVLSALTDPSDRTVWVPVVHRVSGDDLWVVHLVGQATFKRIADSVLGPLHGWVQLRTAQGALLGETTTVAQLEGKPAAVRAAAMSVAEAMKGPLDFDSTRALVAKADNPGRALLVSVGLLEADVLREFKARVDATWLIIGCALAFAMVMVSLTSYALVKFKRTEKYLRSLATTDILTGLPNRRSFESILSRLLQVSQRKEEALALFFIDLDNFKDVNDTMGHPAGDALLQHVGAILSRIVSESSHVCRLGGDEFTVLVKGIETPQQARLHGEHILQELRGVFMLKDVEIEPMASVGVALAPLHASNETDLMRFADTALYHAKRHGKSCCVVYDNSMAAQALAKAQSVRELGRAIAQDELFLVYQPKYHLASGALTGHEALVRWAHPVRGLVSPGEFIPLAEESGLINELGNWVLRRAVRQIKQWHIEGKGWHKVAVNVSTLQLRDDRFVGFVKDTLIECQVPGRCLQVEITESSLAENIDKAKALVSELRRLDVSIAIDDFGTGYSSLSTLSQFEIDCLKVDRSFVNVLLTKEGESICRAIIGLGHSLDMSVIAEGVETADQAVVLAMLECNEVQGFLYSKPQPPEVAVTLLQAPALASAKEASARRAASVVKLVASAAA